MAENSFIAKFNELLNENGLNRKKFADKSGIPYPTVIGWTNLGRLPDYNALVTIADFFECSIDYLTGRQDDFGNIYHSVELTDAERNLIKNYRKLNPENKQIISSLTSKLVK